MLQFIEAALRFSQDPAGYGELGTVELGFGDFNLKASPLALVTDTPTPCTLLNTNPNGPDLIRGGPGWLETDKWTIEATAPGDAAAPARTVMMGVMLRALLEDRFHLKTHRGTEVSAQGESR